MLRILPEQTIRGDGSIGQWQELKQGGGKN